MEKNDLEWLSSIVSFAKIMDIEFSGPGGVISQSGCKEAVHNPPSRPPSRRGLTVFNKNLVENR